MKYSCFGDFIRSRRIAKKINIRQLAKMLDCSPSYVSSVEQSHRNPYDRERLEKLSSILDMTEEEKNEMFTLAGKSKILKSGDTVSVDISDYIRENDFVSAALRTAKNLNAGEAEWARFVDDLKHRQSSIT